MNTREIIKALEPYNLTQVAAATGVHRQTLYRIVNGHQQPSPLVRRALVEFLWPGRSAGHD